jgi:hypothetical protein
LAQSGHRDRAEECPLSGVKRTLQFDGVMSAIDLACVKTHSVM